MLQKLKDLYEEEFVNAEKRSKNLKYLRNIGLFVVAVVAIRKYGELLLPPPAEELSKMVAQQNQMLMQQMHGAASS